MTGTDLDMGRTFDLTRDPKELWNDAMLEVVTRQVFRGMDVTKTELYYCLTIAESLSLNPLIGEIYFIPSKSRDGKGPARTAYVGRNGLVKKARERGYYYESDTVHENDKFTVARTRAGARTVSHNYGFADRGEIVGAYAFLHAREGSEVPSFFLAKIDEYLPTFDADWKMKASPWGNQTSAMIEKCAMIGAGRKRLDLGNVLADGEVAIVQQMGEIGPERPHTPAGDFDFATVTQDETLEKRLRAAADGAGWPPAKCELMAKHARDDGDLAALAERMEAEAAARGQEPVRATNHVQDEVDRVTEALEQRERDPEIADAEVVEITAEDEQRAEILRGRISTLEKRLRGASDPREQDELQAEIDHVGAELAAIGNPAQNSLPL